MRIMQLILSLLTVAALLFLFPSIGLGAEAHDSLKVDKITRVEYNKVHKVGSSTLPPGTYKVEHRVHDSGNHFVHFTPKDRSGEEVVEPVRCEMEPSGRKIRLTRTDTVTENGVRRIRSIKVEGNNAAFMFQ